ncbi:hypothetical protein AMATHDRAFT_48863 [Amanita thiersii Skay4041]|uniref:SET domain-containing protein n=1 Tax=Amanita thiersii Skay4041 TaxID=703135 RepID=A0A2A9NLV8_9AGAR|nr:hypothetical protein AMATHDRAFT_48863 [Amanita thiersii Skay4041]
MASSKSTSSVLTIAGITLVTGFLAYAVYFDYRRRNDTGFRKKLRKSLPYFQQGKDKKRVDKAVSESQEASSSSEPNQSSPEMLRNALAEVKNEEVPTSPEERETYFMNQVSIGEQLASKGPDFHLQSALYFFRALRVYPSPVELIMIYQKTVPEPVFKVIMELTNQNVSNPPSPSQQHLELAEDLDEGTSPTRTSPPSETSSQEWDRITDPGVQTPVKDQVEGYYNYFPPKSMNVAVEPRTIPGSQTVRNVLVLTKDFSAGEVIYKEFPIVTALDADLEAAGTYCSQCLRRIDPSSSSVKPSETSNPLSSTYCSETCMSAAKAQSHSLLFTLDSPLPPEIPTGPIPASALEARKAAQAKFIEHIKQDARSSTLLVAKFIARQVAIETNKMVNASKAAVSKGSETAQETNDFTDAEGGEYLLADHIERLRFLELTAQPEALKLLAQVLETALPGLEQFITEERHATLIGKMAYNAYGVYYDGGRDDKPEPTRRPEDVEKTRASVGTQRQIGAAFYTLSSYLLHSCAPSAHVTFSAGTAQLHLVAERDLKKGDELTIAYVDVAQRDGESALDCRRRRRAELARGWRFACPCAKCEEEGKELAASASASATASVAGESDAAASDNTGVVIINKEKGMEDVSSDFQDESKVEPSLSRFEAAQKEKTEGGQD